MRFVLLSSEYKGVKIKDADECPIQDTPSQEQGLRTQDAKLRMKTVL